MRQLLLTNLVSKTKKTKAQFTPRHGSRDPKTTTQGVSDTDKDIKEEVEKIRDT
jgi:hypothetical protein